MRPSSCSDFSTAMWICGPALRVSRSAGREIAVLAAGTSELTARTLFPSARFVYGQSASLHLLAVQSVDRGGAGGGIAHRDEPEAARAAGHAIVNQRHFGHGAVLF